MARQRAIFFVYPVPEEMKMQTVNYFRHMAGRVLIVGSAFRNLLLAAV